MGCHVSMSAVLWHGCHNVFPELSPLQSSAPCLTGFTPVLPPLFSTSCTDWSQSCPTLQQGPPLLHPRPLPEPQSEWEVAHPQIMEDQAAILGHLAIM